MIGTPLFAIAFDWTISLGVVLQIGGLALTAYVVYRAAKKEAMQVYDEAVTKIDQHGAGIRQLTEGLKAHTDRLDRYEQQANARMDRYDLTNQKIMNDLQRMIGRIEGAK